MNLDEAQKESERLGGWLALSKVENGKHAKFLKGEWHKQLNEIQESYSKIDTRNPSKEQVVQQVVMIQSEEKMVKNQLAEFQDLQIRKNVLDKQIAEMIKATTLEEIPDPLYRQPE